MNGLDTFTIVAVAIMVIAGAGFVSGGVWQLRRGPVTAREAVKWRHRVRQQGLDAQEGMRPALTDAFVLAWRRFWAGILFGFGVGIIAGGLAFLAISLAVTSSSDGQQRLIILVFGQTLLGGLGFGLCLGNLWGLSGMRRVAPGAPPQRPLSAYRSWLLPAIFLVVVLGTGAFAAYAASLLLAMPPYTPALGDFPPPSPVVLSVAAMPLLVLLLIAEVVARRIAALPPLALPMDSPLAIPYDDKLKALAIGGTYRSFPFLFLMGGNSVALYATSFQLGEAFTKLAMAFIISMALLAVMLFYFSTLASWRSNYILGA